MAKRTRPASRESRASAASLTAAQLAEMLSRASDTEITEEHIKADIDAGAPTNPDGTINLLQYGAWTVQALARTRGRRVD